MTRFIDNDGRKMEIQMVDVKSGCDWEYDFFEVGAMMFDEEEDAYRAADCEFLADATREYAGYNSMLTITYVTRLYTMG